MTGFNIHFIYEDDKSAASTFASTLIGEFGHSNLDDADHVVSIGGDGLLLQALRRGGGRKVCGLIPPGSNSRGFWTNRNITSPEQLADCLTNGNHYEVKPLKADIIFADGSYASRTAYNDISIRSVQTPTPQHLVEQYNLDPVDVSIQSALLNLSVTFAGVTRGPDRIIGTGIILSTPYGSTAMGHNYGGSAIDLRLDAISLTFMGAAGGLKPIVNPGSASFDIEVGSPHKRPVLMTFDSFAIERNLEGSPVTAIHVEACPEDAAELVLTDDPASRTYSAFSPKPD